MTDYGTAWSCVEDLTMPAVLVSGLRVVGEAMARRLQTPRGGLIDDPNYGFALSEYVNDDITPADLANIKANTLAEAQKDERIISATVTVVLASDGLLVTTIKAQTSSGPFKLVLSSSDVTTQILQVTT